MTCLGSLPCPNCYVAHVKCLQTILTFLLYISTVKTNLKPVVMAGLPANCKNYVPDKLWSFSICKGLKVALAI